MRMRGSIVVLGYGCLASLILTGCPNAPAGPMRTDSGVRDAVADGSDDTGLRGDCTGAADGTGCLLLDGVDRTICIHGMCVPSRCGDGVVDRSSLSGHVPEDCDDGNLMSGDGCEYGCVPTCTTNATCVDQESCNGVETCGVAQVNGARVCVPGTAAAADTPCMVNGETGTCRNGHCGLPACGNMQVESGEDCDDGRNGDQSDGCTDSCFFTCRIDAHCEDGNLCTTNTCSPTTHMCSVAGVTCRSDLSMCTEERCDSQLGCLSDGTLNDIDGDGYFRTSCGGDDCDDQHATAFPGVTELCADQIDNDCNGQIDDVTTVWYADCDRDGFAAMGAETRTVCGTPVGAPATCANGGWTHLIPQVRRIGLRRINNIDCADTEPRANPRASLYYDTPRAGVGGFDFNCDGAETFDTTIPLDVTNPLCRADLNSCDTGGRLVLPEMACGAVGVVRRCRTLSTFPYCELDGGFTERRNARCR